MQQAGQAPKGIVLAAKIVYENPELTCSIRKTAKGGFRLFGLKERSFNRKYILLLFQIIILKLFYMLALLLSFPSAPLA